MEWYGCIHIQREVSRGEHSTYREISFQRWDPQFQQPKCWMVWARFMDQWVCLGQNAWCICTWLYFIFQALFWRTFLTKLVPFGMGNDACLYIYIYTYGEREREVIWQNMDDHKTSRTYSWCLAAKCTHAFWNITNCNQTAIVMEKSSKPHELIHLIVPFTSAVMEEHHSKVVDSLKLKNMYIPYLP